MYNQIKHLAFKIISTDNRNSSAYKLFNILIVFLIVVNVFIIILESCIIFPPDILEIFDHIELLSIVIFSLEYLLRLWTADLLYPKLTKVKAITKYICSFMALVDLISILPFYLPLILPLDLMILRMLRLIRLIRILKVNRYTKALSTVSSILAEKAPQLLSSLLVIFVLMLIAAVLMYNIEHEAQPHVFINIFSGLWWSVSTFTTVGYGDIYPITAMGQILGAVISIFGISLIAIPTGIISAGFMEKTARHNYSSADEILKYKRLMDMGIITDNEFQAKKNKLLNEN
mgnify:CR=1 FL=1